jgi:oxaloacetate decarboxylase gamma subunit
MLEITEGLVLMLIGMSTVFLFLSLLVILISLSSKVITRFWPEEVETPATKTAQEDDTLIAVIATAIHQYRKKHR